MIELKDICKSFGDHVVLKNFSLKINDNEFIAVSYTHLTLPTKRIV